MPSNPLAELKATCGPTHVAAGERRDAVGGVMPVHVAAPGSTEEAAGVMRTAHRGDLATVIRGGGSKLAWGAAPSRLDLLLRTDRLCGVVDHVADDMIAVVGAGTPLSDLQASLGKQGQRLALDPPGQAATVGGVLAANVSGPLRLRYGTARDLLLGITIVRADGVVAHAGGRVVKNVAGYDLGKLFIGSFGTLGVITQATFRLHPLPAARMFINAATDSARVAAQCVSVLVGSSAVPSAIEIDRPDPTGPIALCVLLEGSAEGVETRARAIRRLLLGHVDNIDAGETQPSWWGVNPFTAIETALRVSYPLASLDAVLDAIARQARAYDVPAPARGAASSGVVHVSVPAGTDAAATARFVTGARAALLAVGGTLVVLHLALDGDVGIDRWGPVPAAGLMRAVRDQFDPTRLFAPNRFEWAT